MMKTNTIRKPGNLDQTTNLTQDNSDSNFKQQFWHSLKDTINTKKENQSIKGRIFTAKRILTPIIQELMKDALKQIEEEDKEEKKNDKRVEILYNNVKAKDVWHVQTNPLNESEEWAMKILNEISRDLEQPFEKLHQKGDEHIQQEKQSPKDILLNKRLLMKLEAIHEHLGNIIERLKDKCKTKKTEEIDKRTQKHKQQEKNTEISKLVHADSSYTCRKKERKFKSFNVNSLEIKQTNIEYPIQNTGIYEGSFIPEGRGDIRNIGNTFSPISFNNQETRGVSISSKMLHDDAAPYHALFEENKNNSGNKQVVIKCLEDLEEVRMYLEALRDNKDCEKPNFTDLESCKNASCPESRPHLHSHLQHTPMVLKLNKHAEENERNSDLIIGIPSITTSSPDVHILLNTKKQQDDVRPVPGKTNRVQNSYRISRIPKPIEKKRVENYSRSGSMKSRLEEKGSSRKKAGNVLIFDPDDPCNSIIKMKEQKMEYCSSRSVVSRTNFTLEIMIVRLKFCCIGGHNIELKVIIESWVFVEWCLVMKNNTVELLCLRELNKFVTLSSCNFCLSFSKSACIYHSMVSDRNCLSVEETKNLVYKRYLDQYVEHILNFKFFVKGSLKHQDRKAYGKTTSVPALDFESFYTRGTRVQTVYFFECIWENKERPKLESSPRRSWNMQSDNVAIFPVWTIKRSKYYSVPKSKKKDVVIPKKKVEQKKQKEKTDSLQFSPDSLEVVSESHNEIQMQISKISVHSVDITPDMVETECEKNKKNEIKRKVSFREEVDISGSCEQKQSENRLSDTVENRDLPEAPDSKQSLFDEEPEESPSFERQEDFHELSPRISDLLMTESLIRITEEIPRSKKLKQTTKKKSVQNLKLTHSARQMLSKLSKSFANEENSSSSSTIRRDNITEFYDKNGNQITEICDSEGELLFKLKCNNGHILTSILFDSDGAFVENLYDVNGKRIRTVFDEDGTAVKHLSQIMDDVQEELEPMAYYDSKGKLIKSVYDQSGHQIKPVGRDLTASLFHDDGRLNRNLCTKKGEKIEVVYDSRGRILGKAPFSHVRIAEMEENGSSSTKFDSLQDGNPDKKGEPIKLTCSEKADKLLPFLLNKRGKTQSKRYSLNGDELTAVFGEDGTALGEMSIAWLHELLVGNKECKSKTKRKESIRKRKRRSQTKTNDQLNIEKLFEINGKIITGVYDAKGKPLVVSLSGDGKKMLPFLFDSRGKFIKKRYNAEAQKIRCVCSENGHIIKSISASYLHKLSENLDKEPDQSNVQDEIQANDTENVNQNVEDTKILDLFEKIADELYDENGNILKEIFDSDGNVLEASVSGTAWKLLPHLFNTNGDFLKNRFHKNGKEILAVYNKDGDDLNKALSTAIQITMKQNPVRNETKESNENEDKNNVDEMDTRVSISENISSVAVTKNNGEQEENLEKPVESVANKQSTESFDGTEETLRNGSSIREFYDERGNLITEVYDYRGRKLVHTKSGDVESLVKVLFNKEGFVAENIYDRKGRKITRLFDRTQNSISRISITSTASGKPNAFKRIKTPGRVYDKNGNAVTEIYDKKGHPILVTKLADVEDVAPIIFDENGVRRRLYNKSGDAIGPVFDHEGNELKYPLKDTKIFSKSGRPLRNFYDSEANLITALYNDYGDILCSVKKGVDNVEKLSKFLFDKDGNFFRGRFYDINGQMIEHIYDSDLNLVRSIKRTESRRFPSTHHEDETSRRKPIGKIKKLRINLKNDSKHKLRDEKNNDIKNLSSQSDNVINPGSPIIQRSISAYSLRDNRKCKEAKSLSTGSSIQSLVNTTVEKFFDDKGRLLTGVYNSKARLLGYSASGNARVLAPYLFDSKGNFISGRFNMNRKPLKQIYDSEGKLIVKISKHALNKKKGLRFQDANSDDITSLYDLRKIVDVTDSRDQIANLFDKNGQLKKNLYNYRGSRLRVCDVKSETASSGSSTDDDNGRYEMRESKGRFSIFSNFRDRLLTVIFDSQQRLVEKFTLQPSKKRSYRQEKQTVIKKTIADINKRIRNLYDKDLNQINHIYDDAGNIIKRVYNSHGDIIDELYSASGTLVKNKVLRNMFENSVFKPKVFNSKGNLIGDIYSNKKKLTEVFDEKGCPAVVDSDLIYLVSDQSLPTDGTRKSTPKQVNYFSEGSTYPFPEGENQIRQIENELLTMQAINDENGMDVAAYKDFPRRTDKCVCENCLRLGRNRNNFVQFGEEIFHRLSRFTLPLGKLLSQSFARRDSEDIDEFDSSESLSKHDGNSRENSKGSISTLNGSEENVPISRKMIEKTLRNCVHLSSSTEMVGNVSDTVLQHYVTLILREIEQKFYHKLSILQFGQNRSEESFNVFQVDGEKDICIGAELKYDNGSISGHTSASSTYEKSDISVNSSDSSARDIELYSYFKENFMEEDNANGKAFVCKVPNLQPFIMMMKSKMESLSKNLKGGELNWTEIWSSFPDY